MLIGIGLIACAVLVGIIVFLEQRAGESRFNRLLGVALQLDGENLLLKKKLWQAVQLIESNMPKERALAELGPVPSGADVTLHEQARDDLLQAMSKAVRKK